MGKGKGIVSIVIGFHQCAQPGTYLLRVIGFQLTLNYPQGLTLTSPVETRCEKRLYSVSFLFVSISWRSYG
jgi:hypothetical protein